MKIYKEGYTSVALNGTEYFADENGIIDVPDDKLPTTVWGLGFVSAKGRIAQLEAEAYEKAAAPIEKPVAVAVATKTETTVKDK